MSAADSSDSVKSLGPSHQLATACPYCDRRNDLHAPINDTAAPDAGDFAVCIECAGVSVFGRGMMLRPPTPNEEATIHESAEIQAAIALVRTAPR